MEIFLSIQFKLSNFFRFVMAILCLFMALMLFKLFDGFQRSGELLKRKFLMIL